jgi:hypothetical protein
MIAGAILLAAFVTGCTKDPVANLNDDESRIFITNRNENADFSSYSTFSIADSVAVIENNQLTAKERTSFDANLINAFVSNLEQRGYTRVDNNAGPDLGITINRIYNDYTGIIDYGSYWDYYGGYWDPYYWGYGGYSYFYPSFYGIYTITSGAIEADMFDLKNAANTNQLSYVWNGMIRGEGTFNQNKTQANVKALFDQSPYLKRN